MFYQVKCTLQNIITLNKLNKELSKPEKHIIKKPDDVVVIRTKPALNKMFI